MTLDLQALKPAYDVVISKASIYHFWSLDKEDALFFDQPYQRPYEWEEKEQQAFLNSLLAGHDIGKIAMSAHETDPHLQNVVDGKQRLTTALLFFYGKLPFIHQGKEWFFNNPSHFALPEQRELKKRPLSLAELSYRSGKGVALKDQIDYFYRVNYTGKPLSQEHFNKVMGLIAEN